MIVTEKLIAEECMAEINCAIHKLQESIDRLERLLGRDSETVQYEQIINIWENPNLTESQEVIEQLAAELKELQEPVEADNCERRVKEFGQKYLLVIKQLAAYLRELQERRKADSCEGCVFEEGSFLRCMKCKRYKKYYDRYEAGGRTDG